MSKKYLIPFLLIIVAILAITLLSVRHQVAAGPVVDPSGVANGVGIDPFGIAEGNGIDPHGVAEGNAMR